MKKLFLFLFTLISMVSFGQTIATGSTVANQLVIDIPINGTTLTGTTYTLGGGGSRTQGLLLLPPTYNQVGHETDRYAFMIFLHGTGEGSSDNVTEVSNVSLPSLIKNGMTDIYGIDSTTGDTVRYIILSPHAHSTNYSYSYTQVRNIYSFMVNNYRIDTTRTWVTGLSAGASGTWSCMMGDTLFAQRLTGIAPFANGGWDDNINNTTFRRNLDSMAKRGKAFFINVGTQDPGYIGAQKYRDTIAVYAQPKRLFYNAVLNGTHSSNVWDPPYQFNSRLWNPAKNMWDQMASIKRVVAVATLSANAGLDKSVTLPTSTTTLNGTATTPAGTTISTYSWTKLSGPTGGNITTPNTASTSITALTTGTYTFRLTVTNSASNSASDDIVVTVNPVPNTPPTANAGVDKTVTQPATTSTMTGSSSDADGTVASNTWTFISGPSTPVITTASSLTSGITALTTVGTYVFRLTVIDNGGATTTDDVNIVVQASAPTTLRVKKIATSEYRVSYLYTDGSIRSNYDIGGAKLFAYNVGVGRTFIDVAMGFNVSVMVDDQHHVWESRVNSITCDQVLTDTTGATFTCDSVFANFSARFGLKSDGSLWFWGTNDDNYDFYPGVNGTFRPNKISGTMVIKKVCPGLRLVVLLTNGQIWEWARGSGAWVQKTTPGNRIATDIAAGAGYSFFAAIIPDAVPASQVDGPVYVWGSDFGFWRGTGALANSLAQPTSVKTLWNMTVNAKKVYANQNIIAYIDVNNIAHTIGDNPNGELGNGQELVNRQELYKPRSVCNWTWTKGEFYDGPSQISVGGKQVRELFLGNNYTFYVYAQTIDDSTYFWGRDKGLVGGFGYTMSQSDIYANVLDKVLPTATIPIASGNGFYCATAISTLNAGADQSITNSSTTLNAIGTPTSLTASGFGGITYTITSYAWRKLSGGPATILSPSSANTIVNGMADGVYQFECLIRDIQTGSRTDTVQITVNLNTNVPPVITITSGNPTITLPTSSTAVGGTVSDVDGTIALVQWTKVSGPSQFTINSPNVSSTTVSNLVQGTYIFRLTVTDNLGGTTTADVTVTVNPVPPFILSPVKKHIEKLYNYKIF